MHVFRFYIGVLCFAYLAFSPASGGAEDRLLSPVEIHWDALRKESKKKKTVLFVPRLLGKSAQQLVRARVVKRAINLGKGIGYLFYKPRKSAHALSDSLINPGGTLNDLISDATALIKSPMYANSKFTSRVQLCSGNLSSAATLPLFTNFIMPALHVGLLIDETYETVDPGGGGLLRTVQNQGSVMCSPLPLRTPEPESVIIERLMCLNQTYNVDYSFFRNNCGTYTRDLLRLSGLGFPALPNIAIGVAFKKTYEDELKRAEKFCSENLVRVKEVFHHLEDGHLLEPTNLPLILSPDARLQLYVSAARGKNAHNREWVHQQLKYIDFARAYFKNKTELKRSYVTNLRGILTELDEESLLWLQSVRPEIIRLYQLIWAPEKPQDQDDRKQEQSEDSAGLGVS